MNSAATAALTSWNLDGPVSAVLLLLCAIYVRGWRRERLLIHLQSDSLRLTGFLSGVFVLFVAVESPLDSFDGTYLAAHMAQHLLLMMVAPPLILLSHPVLPLLKGLPKSFVKEGLGPFLTWRPLRSFLEWLTAPLVAWLLFVASTIVWHLPYCYELALGSRVWHGAQHASFFWTGIVFWWFIVEPGPGKSRWPRWAGIPYLLTADIVNTALSAIFVFSGRVLYPSYAAVHLTRAQTLSDQTLGGLIMWVPGEIIYLIPAFFLTMRVLTGSKRQGEYIVRQARATRAGRRSLAANLARWRRPIQLAMLLVSLLVIADGFWGPQITPINLAGILPWIHWRGLSVLSLLFLGNLFCMACPFTFVRDLGRKVMPARLRWPRQLRNKWTPALLFLLYLWSYEAFGVWDSPWITAWIIAGYFGAALVVDGLFRGASFCKYVCPIGQFNFISSLISPREVAIKSPQVCRSCQTYDCIRGNEQTHGCELYLFQPKKSGNLDCTFCLDCVKACPHGNIDLVSITPAQTLTADPYRSSIGRLSSRTDLAVLVLLFVFGAFVNAAGMVAPVVMREHAWHASLGMDAMPWIVGAFVLVGAVLVPAMAVSAAGFLSKISWRGRKVGTIVRRFVFALVPIGFGMWAAHILYHLATGWNAPWPALARALAGTAAAVALPAVPSWLTPLQILTLNAGLLLTLWVLWKVATESAGQVRAAVALVWPWMAVSVGLYAAGVWVLFQPMQMRGMMH
ncbi:MAG: cytochrome c oxidase assembly protein [Acidobacteriaceae bacterium]|nr:cytochrome c oxidase assembly protein [Acidobacteriaceae bacterium]